MELVVLDLGPYAVSCTVETPEGPVTILNTSERLAEMIPPAD